MKRVTIGVVSILVFLIVALVGIGLLAEPPSNSVTSPPLATRAERLGTAVCPGGAPLSMEQTTAPLEDAKAAEIALITAWLGPTGVKQQPFPILHGMYVFFKTDVRVSFRDDGRHITGLVTLTSTVTELELNRLVRVASLTISGYGGGAEPEIRKEIADAVASRRPGQRLVAIKMYGTLSAVISAPEDGAVVIVIERRKC
jgi:hypothetical protein